MKQFENIAVQTTVDKEEEMLKKAGLDGYELVAVITLVNGQNKYYFKKEKI